MLFLNINYGYRFWVELKKKKEGKISNDFY